MRWRGAWFRVAIGAGLLAATVASAQQDATRLTSVTAEMPANQAGQVQLRSDAEAVGQAPAQPVRAARLTFVSGAVDLQRVDNTAEDAPVINMPVYAGSRLITGDYGQAELEFEDGSVVRLTPRSALSIDDLSLAGGGAKTHLTLLNGLAYLELRRSGSSAYELSAGGLEVTPVENAVVRVSFEQPPAVVAVLVGEARVEHGGDNGWRAEVKAGESLKADAADESRYFLNAQVTPESWDSWNASRDAVAADQADRQTVARDGFAGNQGYGWSDLDSNGSWYDLPGEGPVWQPDVADEGFDPYGYGSWVFGSTGYVWASGYSWGWTPFHCGVWEYLPALGWVWRPGRGCGAWAYGADSDGGGGWGGVRLGHVPGGYKRVGIPIPGPGKVHPILLVSGPDGPRPPVRRHDPVLVGDKMVAPLAPVGSGVGLVGGVLGATLLRDFSVEGGTGKPVLGRMPVREPAVGAAVGGWRPVERMPAAAPTGAPNAAGVPASERRSAGANVSRPASERVVVHPAGEASVPSRSPARQPETAPRNQPPPVASAPARVSAPAPAPVHTAAPAPPASHVEAPSTSKPK